jgi:hypothetical protein
MAAKLQIQIPKYELDFDKKLIKKIMRQAGTELAAAARAILRQSSGSGRIYNGIQASAPGEPPVKRTGELANSIKTKLLRGGMGVSVTDTAVFALSLEAGAAGGGGKKGSGQPRVHQKRSLDERIKAAMLKGNNRVLLPRPYLTLALDQKESSIEDRVRRAIQQGIEFKRIGK